MFRMEGGDSITVVPQGWMYHGVILPAPNLLAERSSVKIHASKARFAIKWGFFCVKHKQIQKI